MPRTTDDLKDYVLKIRVSETFLHMIDGWREDQPDTPGRAEAIRRLCETGVLVKSKIPKR